MKSSNKILSFLGTVFRVIGNAFWFLFTGLFTGIMYFFSGLFWCITIIGIPFGKQAFKLSKLSFFPFGTKVNKNFLKHPIANVIWIILGGLFISLYFALGGVLWCVTIIGIPFGRQCFKLAGLALMPFGATFGEKQEEKEQPSPEQIAAREAEKAEKKQRRMEKRAEKKRYREEHRDERIKKRADVTLILSYIFLPLTGVLNVPFSIISYRLSKKSCFCKGLKRYKVALIFNITCFVLMIAATVVLNLTIWRPISG